MKTLLVWTLLAVIPASSLRIICVASPDAVEAGAARNDVDLACQTICSKAAHARETRPAHTTCVLVDDPSCAFALGMPIAVLPATATLSFARTVERFETAAPTAYPVPVLDSASPPPKA